MGTLCKNCPVKNSNRGEGETCMAAFSRMYGNSCVNLDVTELELEKNRKKFNKEMEEFSNQKKEENDKVTAKKASPKKSSSPRKASTRKKKEANTNTNEAEALTA